MFEVTTYMNNSEIKSEDIKVRSKSFYEIVNKHIRTRDKEDTNKIEKRVSDL